MLSTLSEDAQVRQPLVCSEQVMYSVGQNVKMVAWPTREGGLVSSLPESADCAGTEGSVDIIKRRVAGIVTCKARA